ncbi:MAG: PEP/pyruvate-binding domain-containing protein [bacterium]
MEKAERITEFTERITESTIDAIRREIGREKISYEHIYRLENGYTLIAVVSKEKEQEGRQKQAARQGEQEGRPEKEGFYRVTLATDIPGPLILHWGVGGRFLFEWTLPPPSIRPEGTTLFQNSAARTPFADQPVRQGKEGMAMRILHLQMGEQEAPRGISFVLFQPASGLWIKDHGRNFTIPVIIPDQYSKVLGDPGLIALAEAIIDREMNSGSWTLMHRFNLCHDLLDEIPLHNLDGLALLFVWLRFSAIRQLDWQRNYNTKPSELSHAEDRLTIKLAERYAVTRAGEEAGESQGAMAMTGETDRAAGTTERAGKNEPSGARGATERAARGRELVRLLLTTLGRGGEGQKVRDEVLHIMHRYGIKEVSGHFLEEWHQKLHNNTTPDDVVICEAYLEFLKGNGNTDLFYRKLMEAGITKERLESYERPIRSHPEFMPHLKDALIHDFEYFLGILKSVHSGTDLGIAIQAARYLFDANMHGLMDFIWFHQADPWTPAGTLAESITEGRRRLASRLQGSLEEPSYQVRDMLFLDQALEEFLRVVIERTSYSLLEGNQLVDLAALMLENLNLTRPDDELAAIFRHWGRLKQMPRFGKDWSLRAEAALSRLRRVLGVYIDDYYQLLQPKAEFLGQAFRAESWTINLFSEEVIRGRSAFILAMLLRSLDPILRQNADLGNWQVISRNRVTGEVKVVDVLQSVQDKRYTRPTVIIADHVTGEENIPEGAAAVITSDPVDIVSHVAIRARNARLLFATCYDPQIIKRLKSLERQVIRLDVNVSGELVIEEKPGAERTKAPSVKAPKAAMPEHRPGFTAYAVPMSDFSEHTVGSKSNNLRRLYGRLPEWISLPTSVALPYGVFERVLEERSNKDIARHYQELTGQLVREEETGAKAGAEAGAGAGAEPGGTGSEAENAGRERLKERLDDLRRSILALEAPDELVSSLHRIMEQAGLPWPANWDEAWMCIKRVWGSKWNDRAYLSRRASGISHDAVFMAVLVQRVVEADYSFVIHTVNPLANDRDTMYAEAVLGLGETLVSDYPGRALGFLCSKRECNPQFLAFPSKSVGLFGGGLIFRSDFSGEDLSAYAGAGLYSSIMLPQPRKVLLDYTDERLVWDDDFRKGFLTAVSRIGTIVEQTLGFPQDIEGAYSKEHYYVVQARPQVGIENQK